MKHRIIILLVSIALAIVLAASWGTLVPTGHSASWGTTRPSVYPGDGGPVAACNDLRLGWTMTGTNGLTYVCVFGYPDYWAWTGH